MGPCFITFKVQLVTYGRGAGLRPIKAVTFQLMLNLSIIKRYSNAHPQSHTLALIIDG